MEPATDLGLNEPWPLGTIKREACCVHGPLQKWWRMNEGLQHRQTAWLAARYLLSPFQPIHFPPESKMREKLHFHPLHFSVKQLYYVLDAQDNSLYWAYTHGRDTDYYLCNGYLTIACFLHHLAGQRDYYHHMSTSTLW